MLGGSQIRSPGSLRLLCESAPDFGVEAGDCLAGTGLEVFDLYRPDAKVTLSQEVEAIANFVRHAPGNPGLGIEIGLRYRPEMFGIWGYAILSSPNLRAALKTAVEFSNLSSIIATLSIDEEPSEPLMLFDADGLPPEVKTFVLGRHLTVVLNFFRSMWPDFSASLLSIRTTLSDPAFAQALHNRLGVPVTLGCSVDAIALPEGFLEVKLPKYDPVVLQNCLRECRSLLQPMYEPEPYWTTRVRDTTLLEIDNEPSITTIAAKMGMTERTLRRRLASEGANFRQILVDARLSIGMELLKTTGLDVSTVAWRTGYSEPSSFVRAFSKRFGFTPGELKKELIPEY